MSTTGKMSGLDAYRGERLYTRTSLRTNTFTVIHIYRRTHLQSNTFIAKNIYSQNNLQSNTFTVEIFTVQCIIDTGIFLQVIKVTDLFMPQLLACVYPRM